MRSKLILFGVLLLALAAVWWMRHGRGSKPPSVPPVSEPLPLAQSTIPVSGVSGGVAVSSPAIPALSVAASPSKKAAPAAKAKSQLMPSAKPAMPALPVPPPVEIHKELIPKNILIVRFYYTHPISGPDSRLEFEINGSGFTTEFERMITVRSGHERIAVNGLKLVTPNQIHGEFSIGEDVKTGFVFPQVLIAGKVVFQAPDPFAVIRPGEILNLVFTEMEEGGRSGWFRVYTNLMEEMFQNFSVAASTPGISITNLQPEFPFIVNGRLEIGWQVPEGAYDLFIQYGGKKIWERPGVVQVIKPNVGAAGLVQKVITVDGFHRPGDAAKFVLQGSGFQPMDVNLLTAKIADQPHFPSTFSFVAPGRMDLTVEIPLTAEPTNYNLGIFQGEKRLFHVAPAFSVVSKNWVRSLEVSPAFKPGSSGRLTLRGRDLDKEFVEDLEIEVDEPGLVVGRFSLESPDSASASISVDASVAPGDYWLKMSHQGKAVRPQFGSIIRVER